MTLSGAHLGAATLVTLGGEPCAPLTVASDGEVTCRAPALPAGLHDVTLSTPAGDATLVAAWESWSPSLLEGARLFQADAGVHLDGPLAEVPTWSLVAGTAPWRPRDGAGLVHAFGRLWLLGGWDPGAPAEWQGQVTTNEVWVSDDGGATWAAVAGHDPAPPESGPGARWTPRHTAGWLRHEVDGVEYLYVVGGDIFNGGVPDVWRSADGETWERVLAAAPWGPRVLHMVGVFQGDLYVMGGQLDIADPATCLADVWRSSDGGETWEQLADAPWAPRGMVYGLVEHQGALWLAGGGTYDDAPRTYYGDVWRFDGATWTEVLPDGAAPWIPREYHNVFVWEGELWLSSGYAADDLNHDDVWHSADGVTWEELPAKAFAAGHADGVAVTPDGPVHASGNAFDAEVFRLGRARSAPISQWDDLGAGGLPVRPADARPAWVEGAFGGLGGVELAGGARLVRDAWDGQPDGRSVFWVGATRRQATPLDGPDAGQTVVGDSLGSCRAEAGYGGDQLELVLTDASGSWAAGRMLRGAGLTDGATRLVGFTLGADGAAQAWVDGVPEGEPFAGSYDGPYMGWDTLGAGFGGAPAHVLLGAVLVLPFAASAADVERLGHWARKFGG